jgi:molybdopterin molybdotransferase
MAVRVCLETITPPVFGKETDKVKADTPNTGIGFFGTGSRNERILQSSNAGPTLQENGSFQALSFEKVSLEDALQRVLYEDIISPNNVPEFPRSTVDGFAVRAEDTYGTSEKNPALLRVVGEILMGQVSDKELRDGETIKVATGGMVPKGANAVEMVEYTESVDSHTIHVFKVLSPLENVIK